VALYNGKEDPTKIAAGETLRLPYSTTVTLKKGESLSQLARRIWGDVEKYPVIAWANGIQDPEKVPVGTRLVVPVLFPYRLAKGESISSAAGRFYEDPKQFTPIAVASGIGDPARVPAGTLLKVPYIFPRTVKKPAPVKKEEAEDRASSERAVALLKQAEADFRAGQYGKAWTAGHEASKGLKGENRAKAMRLLAASQYAFGKTVEALEHLREAHRLDPGFSPDPAYVNPEMMELYRKAREH
jgi:hypothetical protein